MKKTIIKTIIKAPELTVAVALITGLVAMSTAAEIPTGKGLSRLLTKPVPTFAGTPSSLADCSRCQDIFVVRTDASARGANKCEVKQARHLCRSCETTIRSVGSGKATQQVAQHQCLMTTAQALASCCGGQAGLASPGCEPK